MIVGSPGGPRKDRVEERHARRRARTRELNAQIGSQPAYRRRGVRRGARHGRSRAAARCRARSHRGHRRRRRRRVQQERTRSVWNPRAASTAISPVPLVDASAIARVTSLAPTLRAFVVARSMRLPMGGAAIGGPTSTGGAAGPSLRRSRSRSIAREAVAVRATRISSVARVVRIRMITRSSSGASSPHGSCVETVLGQCRWLGVVIATRSPRIARRAETRDLVVDRFAHARPRG